MIKINNPTSIPAETDPLSLHLDQTTPQTIVNDVPLLESTRTIDELHQLVDKKYVDEAVTALGARFYMTNTGSGVTQPVTLEEYYLTAPTDPVALFDIAFASLVNAQFVVGWISPLGATFSKLIAGVYDWNIFAARTAGTRTLRVYWTLVERKADDSETVIATSATSDEIVTKRRLRVPLTLSNDYTITAGSRIIGKIYAVVGASGSAPTLTLYGGGVDDSHWEIPTNTEILSNNFLTLDQTTPQSMTGLADGFLNLTGGVLGTGTVDLSSKQDADDDLTAIAALGFASTSFLKKTALNTWALDTNTYLTSVTPAGANTEIQYNNSGALGASSNIRIGSLFLDPSTLPTGAGTRFLWAPTKYAMRAGSVTGTQWDTIGDYSFAVGSNTIASGAGSVCMGSSNTSSGAYSICMGILSTASSPYGIALGFQSNATVGSVPVAIGYQANASANYAIALGRVTASAVEAVAIGSSQTVASGTNSIALGRYSRAIGNYSISIAQNIAGQATSGRAGTNTAHNGAIIIGSATKANALNASEIGAIAIGTDVNATDKYAVALGTDFTNSTANSFAVGFSKKGFELNQVRGTEVCTNGTFATSANWTFPAGWAHDAVNLAADHSSNGTGALEHDQAVVIGETYYVSFEVKNWTSGTVIMAVGGYTSASIGSNGVREYYVTATTTAAIKFTPTNTSRFSIDNVTIKKITHDIYVYGKMKTAEGYQSTDGTDGASTTVSGLVFKNGLYTSGSFTNPSNIKQGEKTVSSGDYSVSVVFADDSDGDSPAAYADGTTVRVPMPAPDWATSVYVTNISTTGFTVNFGTAPGAYGGTISWIASGL